jgi:small conductance mechanosensitive channel
MKQIEIYFERLIAMGVDYLPKVVGAIIIWIIGSWLIRRISKLASFAMKAREFDASLEGFLYSLIDLGLKILLIFTIAGMLGIQTTSFVAVLGAASLAVGLALQGSLGNFAGGVLILIFRPFKVGDVIAAQGQTGAVKEIQIFSTILLAPDSRTIIIPNGSLSNGVIVNYSREGKLGFELEIEIDGRHDFNKVKAVIMEVMESDSRIMSPAVNISKLKAGMVISVTGQSMPEDQKAVISGLNEKFKTTFAQNGFGGPEIHTYVHNMS